jgi:hypothetical protein
MESVSSPVLIRVYQVLSQSIIYLTSSESSRLNSWISSGDLSNDSVLIKLYVDSISSHVGDLISISGPIDTDKTCILSSGLFCFLGQIMLYVSQSGKVDREILDMITHFTLLYLYTDYYLDQKGGVDTEMLSLMKQMVLNPSRMGAPEPRLIREKVNISTPIHLHSSYENGHKIMPSGLPDDKRLGETAIQPPEAQLRLEKVNISTPIHSISSIEIGHKISASGPQDELCQEARIQPPEAQPDVQKSQFLTPIHSNSSIEIGHKISPSSSCHHNESQSQESQNSILSRMMESYRFILEKRSISHQPLVSVFMTEVEGIEYQKNPNLSTEQYLDIAERKGATTAIAIQACLGLQTNDQIYNLGAIIQLLDDMIDVYEDMSNEINTVATDELTKNGNLDRLWCHTALRIGNIKDPFVLFKLTMSEMLLYLLSENVTAFGHRIRRRFSPMIHVNYQKGSRMMEIMSSAIKNILSQKQTLDYER